jgi:hypothetical protein
MKHTKSGFPFVKSPHAYLFALYKRNGYGGNRINTHYSSEKGTAHLHEIMWLLEKEGFIKIDYAGDHGETLFSVRLTMKGFREVYGILHDRKINIYTVVSLVFSLIALVFSIISRFIW